jgi:hypothetical protein
MINQLDRCYTRTRDRQGWQVISGLLNRPPQYEFFRQNSRIHRLHRSREIYIAMLMI